MKISRIAVEYQSLKYFCRIEGTRAARTLQHYGNDDARIQFHHLTYFSLLPSSGVDKAYHLLISPETGFLWAQKFGQLHYHAWIAIPGKKTCNANLARWMEK